MFFSVVGYWSNSVGVVVFGQDAGRAKVGGVGFYNDCVLWVEAHEDWAVVKGLLSLSYVVCGSGDLSKARSCLMSSVCGLATA